MTELQELMRQNVEHPPYDDLDLAGVVSAGRRRARARQLRWGGASSVAVAAAAVVALAGPRMSLDAGPASPPAPDAPVLHLSDATAAVAGRDYEVLASHTDGNLDGDNGQYFDGVTDDGQILFRDGPRPDRLYPRYALLDPSTGTEDWLPHLAIGQADARPVELGTHRLVLVSMGGTAAEGALRAHVFDRDTGQWHTVTWPGLPDVEGPSAVMGPDDRLYVPIPATQGQPPADGWPIGPGGEADDSGAAGDTYELWSVSLSNPDDVRDEHLSVGSVAFTPTSMVWTDRTNGDAGLVHVRTLATGQERAFDPRLGSRCNLLSLSASADRIVMSEYCGDYDGGTTRDDRVQILSTSGDQVLTIQDSGIDGGISAVGGDNDVVTVTANEHAAGTYVYDLTNGRFLRIAHGLSRWALGGPSPAGDFMWNTPVNDGHGATQWLGKLTR